MVRANIKQEVSDITEEVIGDVDIKNVTRLYFSISEVAEKCAVQNHVIRYWEKQFPMLSPLKRKGRRYFTKKDMMLVQQIKSLLYDQGYTIEGAKDKLANQITNKTPRPEKIKHVLEDALSNLSCALDFLKS